MCLDTENIKDSNHRLANREGSRTVHKGDRHRLRPERVTCIPNTHEFTLALADMLDKDEEMTNALISQFS